VDVLRFVRDLERRKIKERILVREDKRGKVLQAKYSIYKYLPAKYLTPVTTVVYGSKVADFIWTEPYYAIVKKNQEVADSYRSHFEILWEIAKK